MTLDIIITTTGNTSKDLDIVIFCFKTIFDFTNMFIVLSKLPKDQLQDSRGTYHSYKGINLKGVLLLTTNFTGPPLTSEERPTSQPRLYSTVFIENRTQVAKS